ncbi:MAG: succinate dehydrogenase assembly factor 2 [Casimicrobiaceae bacterium]
MPTAANAAGPADRLSVTEHNRLRWRCRRGMLENDLILTRFLDARAGAIAADELDALDRLLDLPDDELWELLAGRVEADDPAVMPLLGVLRSL